MTTARTAGGYGEETGPPGPASYAVGLDPTETPGLSITELDGRVVGGGLYWLISHSGHDSTGTPAPRLSCDGSVLPVFSSREEAAEFPCLQHLPGDWRIRVVGPGELLSILLGPSCAGVEAVALDPIPGVPEEVSALLVCVGARRFAVHLARRRMGEFS